MLNAVAPIPRFVVLNTEELESRPLKEFLVDRVRSADLVPPFAVRSSASVEDHPTASYAGMFETVLDVSFDDLPIAVKAVYDSANSARMSAYTTSIGDDFAEASMNVIVQELVDSRVSGVCLTRVPEDIKSVVVVEAVLGLGELLVSGEVEPDVYHFDRESKTVDVVSIGNQSLQQTRGVGPSLVPPVRRRARKLSDKEVSEVAQMALQIESSLALKSVDIEWAFDQRQLWILQARPVASIQ